MRRLRNSRAPEPQEDAVEGFDRLDLEGDAVGPVSDEIPWLRPFGADIPGPVLAPAAEGQPEAERVSAQATELSLRGRRLDAMLLLRRHLEETPRDAAVRGLLARLLDEAGEADTAMEELDRALTSADDAVPLLVHRGAILARQGATAEAERDLRDAIRQRPREAAAHFHLGLTLLRRGKPAEAADCFRETLRHAPETAEVRYHLGEALHAQGDLAGALTALERAAALAPGDPRSFKLMGRLLDKLGRTDEAMAMHRKAREATVR